MFSRYRLIAALAIPQRARPCALAIDVQSASSLSPSADFLRLQPASSSGGKGTGTARISVTTSLIVAVPRIAKQASF